VRRCGLVLVALLAPAALLLGCTAGPQRANDVRETLLLSGFEDDGQLAGWAGGPGVAVESSGEKATEGSRALRVTVPENSTAGVEYHPADGDWSPYTSLRMDIFYPYDDRLVMAVRVDDADSSDYAGRYNLDDGSLVLVPGRNEIELPMRSLASGRPGCRGLDLRRIRNLYLFPLGEHPERTFFVDNVRLEALDPRAFPSPALIDGFEEAGGLARWQVSEGVQVAPAEEQVTEGEWALRVRLPGGASPGITLSGPPRNWLPYDWLLLDIYNDADDTMMLGLRVRDGLGEVTVATVLRPGANRVRIPMDLFSSLRLRTVTGLSIFVSQPASGTVLYLDNIRLARQSVGPAGRQGSGDAIGAAPLTLDYGRLASVARSTGFLANLYVDGSGDERRLVRLRPLEKKLARHSLAVPKGRVVVSSFFLDRDTWHFNTQAVVVAGPETTVLYEPGDFGY